MKLKMIQHIHRERLLFFRFSITHVLQTLYVFIRVARPIYLFFVQSLLVECYMIIMGELKVVMLLLFFLFSCFLFSFRSAHFAVLSKSKRIERLSIQYHFTCKCEACENDYPTYAILQYQCKESIPYIIDGTHTNSLINYDFDFALTNYRKYCEYLTKHGEKYPCHQISSAEESLKMALHILVDAVPLKAKMNPTGGASLIDQMSDTHKEDLQDSFFRKFVNMQERK